MNYIHFAGLLYRKNEKLISSLTCQDEMIVHRCEINLKNLGKYCVLTYTNFDEAFLGWSHLLNDIQYTGQLFLDRKHKSKIHRQ